MYKNPNDDIKIERVKLNNEIEIDDNNNSNNNNNHPISLTYKDQFNNTLIMIANEFKQLITKLETDVDSMRNEVQSLKSEVKSLQNTHSSLCLTNHIPSQKSKQHKKIGFFQLELCQATKKDIVLFFFASLGSIVAGCAMPLISLLLGNVINGFDGTIPIEKVPSVIKGVVTNFCLAGFGIFVGSLLMVICWNIIGHRLSNAIKIDYFRVIMKQEQAWFDQVNTFEFTTKIQTQTQIIENGIGTKVGISLSAMSQFIISFLIGYITSWKLSLVITAMLPLLGLGGWFMANAMKQGTAEMRTYEKAGGMAEEVLYQIKTVASFANFQYEQQRYQDYLTLSRQAGIKQGYKSGFGIGFIIFVIYASYALAIGYGSRLISNPKEINDNTGRVFGAGEVITVLFAIIFGCFSLGQAAPNIKAILEACNAAQDYFELKERKPSSYIHKGTEKPSKDKLIGNLHFLNIQFNYPSDDRMILKDINMSFPCGKKIAIVGPSGIGKSTIFSLIERFYEPIKGMITFDDKNIRNIDIDYWRSLIGYVPQEPVLFNTSIRENIIFGREKITDEDIMAACEKAYATEIIDKCTLDYIVGVKGEKLSGGQRQRIAIARAVLLKPMLLILDEATSALDNKSEKEVQKALDKVSEGITSIIIAHKIDTIKNSDMIYCFDKSGVIVDVGKHEDLVEKNGVYAALYRKRERKEQAKAMRNSLLHVEDKKENVDEEHSNRNEEEEYSAFNKNNQFKGNLTHINHSHSNDHFNEISQLNYSKSSTYKHKYPNKNNNDIDDHHLDLHFNLDHDLDKEDMIHRKTTPLKRITLLSAIKHDNNELKASRHIPNDLASTKDHSHNKEVKENNKLLSNGRKHAFSLLKDNKCFIFGSALFASLNGAIWPIYGILLAMAISVLSDKNHKEVLDGGLVISLSFLALAISAGIVLWMQNYFFYGLGEILTSKYRREVYDKFLNLHMSYFDKKENSPGALLTKLSSDTTKISGVATSIIGQLLQTGITLIVGIVVACIFQWIICLINLAFMPLVIGSYVFQFTLQKGNNEGSKNIEEEAGTILSETIINTKTIFSYNMQGKIVDIYARIIKDNDSKKKKRRSNCHLAINGIFYSLTQFVIFAMYAALFYVGGDLYKDGKATFKDIVTAIFTILFSALGIGIAQMFVGDYAAAKKAIISLQKIINTSSAIDVIESEVNGKVKKTGELLGKIEFRNVRFTYEGTALPVFHDLNFIIEPGQTVAFVGASGSGKSTIISLIERFYDVDNGQVMIDDVDIREYNIVQLRKNIGIVLQQPALFNRSIRENIRYGRLDATEEDIEKAAKDANILPKLTEEDNDGMNREDKGDKDDKNNVSGGEKQRIAIARAILKNPNILLLDEATSALDKENEEMIKESLGKLMKNRTCLIVAHRLSTIINCDKIFVLQYGEIVEIGSHEELMMKNGRYAELYKGSSS